MQVFHRRSIRLKDHDYSTPGGYFVTIVAFQRECLFGGIVNGVMQVNDLGRIVRQEWFRTAELRTYVELLEDEFVVMPNHIHGIIRIIEDDVVPIVVGAQRRCAPTTPLACHMNNVQPRSLGAIIRAFKSAVTYRAGRELNTPRIWQRNYYEHILRNQTEYERIAGYILANPSNWNSDEESINKR
jgi:REP element-mobilizing transposase RayT